MYKCAFLGCGGRARGHANAYAQITRGKIVALCDLDESRLNSFGDDFGVDKRYTDIHEMLDQEKPDVLHIVTQPNLRVPLMTIAAEHNVPAAIVEKPVALGGSDYRAIAELGQRCKTKFVVNHQLRHHPKLIELLNDVNEGRIGDVQFLDVSARLNLSGQGTHVTDLMFAFNNYSRPVLVFGQASGASDMDSAHAAPDMAVAEVIFENGIHALLACGVNATSVGDYPQHYHKRIAVYGTRGFVHWKMEAWERSTTDGGYERGDKSYGEEDVLGQKGLTEAVFDWLDDENKLHPNRLEISLLQVNVILGLYTSTIRRAPVELPIEPEDDLLDDLKKALGG